MTAASVPIPRLPRRESYALSAYQRGLWALIQASPSNPFYNASRIVKLIGPLDIGRFHRALEIAVARHDILRSSFAETESGPVQRIASAVAIDLPLEDLSNLPVAQREARLHQWITETAWSPFDLGTAPLIRCRAFRFAALDHRLVLTAHHLVSDGGSGRLLMEELGLLYQAIGEGSPLPAPAALQYQDFSHWQNEQLRAGAMAVSKAYWLLRLGSDLPVVELPTDRGRPPVPTYRGAQHRRLLSAGLTSQLKELRRRQGTTLFRVILAALDTLLVRLSAETEVIVGSPVSGRTHPALRDVQGLFVNMLALRADLSGDPPFSEVLSRIKESTRGDIAHKDLPFDTLVQCINPRRDPGRPPIFNVVLSMREANFASELEAGPLVMSQDELPLTQFSRYDLTLIVADTPLGLRLTFEYSTDLFDPSSIARLAGHLERLLAGAVTDPGERISRLPLLAEAERAALLREWNDTRREVPGGWLLHERFERQAAACPDRVAVELAGERLTYLQLEGRANQLAHHLQGLGVGPDVPVGLLLERSPELLVAVLAILKAGGAYVPMALDDPRERLSHIAADSRMALVVTRSSHAQSLSGNVPAVLLDREAGEIGRQRTAAPASGATPASLAYVLYTSGSTGVPKGVMVPHGAVVNYLAWCRTAYGMEPGRGSLLHSSIGFDLSVTALLGPLLAGGEVHLAAADAGLRGIAQALEQGPVHLLKLTPAHLEMLRRELAPDLARRVGVLVVGGDTLVGEALDLFRAAAPAMLVVNEYGPTEATVGCSVHGAPAGEIGGGPVPIGRPIANACLYVLSGQMEVLPAGVRGELFIGGSGLARGYLGRPDLTAERFLPDPCGDAPGARLYRTGDLVRRLPAGDLEFLGRNDHQVKIRGVRVEPQEIEEVLLRHPMVREAVVVVREELLGDRRLVACVVPRQEPAPTDGELRGFLAARLPAAMVPAFFVMQEAIPLTAAGKVDRRAMAAAGVRTSGAGSSYVPPRDPVEWELAELWEKALGTPRIGVLDDFFALGGHSLIAVSLVSEINRRFGTTVHAVSLVQAPTIAGMRALLKVAGGNGHGTPFTGNLVPMRSGDPSLPPVLLVHAHRGGVFAYHALARALGGNYPISGFQASGLDEGEEPLDSVPAMAARYVDQIRVLHPRGPYRLVGWSFGGIVAYEMARQLENMGDEVAIVALLDSSPPGDPASAALAVDTLPSIGRAFFGLADEVLAGLDESRGLQLLLARGRDLNLLPSAMTAESLGRLIRVVRAHSQALSTYRPTDVIRADICLLLAATASQVRDPGAWRDRTLGTCSVVTVPGPHHEMVFPPAVGELAAALDHILDGAGPSPAAVAELPAPAQVGERLRFMDPSPDREALSAGLGSCPLVLGECVQGRLSDRRHFLITSPVNAFSWAEFIPDPSLAEVVVDPPARTKAQMAVTRYLAATGRPGGGRLEVFTPIPPGLGFGTSTADIAASVRAAAAAWGEMATPKAIAEIAIAIEPTDGSMYPGSVVFDHRRGELLECLGSLPAFYALVVCGAGEVDTAAFDAHRKDFHYSPQDERELRMAWRMVRYAARKQDVSILGSAATISARINEQLLAKPYFAEMHDFMELAGLEGLIAGHSGTLLAFMLDPHGSGFLEKLDQARAFVDALHPERRFETSNGELRRETRWSARWPIGGAPSGAASHAEPAVAPHLPQLLVEFQDRQREHAVLLTE